MKTIRLEDLTIGYNGKKGQPKVISSGINASLAGGELTCLIGPNGIGKSTLLRTLCGFQPKLGGKIWLHDKDLDDYSEKQLSKLIGIVLTHKPDIQNMTVEELVGLGRSPYTGFWGTLSPQDREIVKEAMEMVGISALCQRMIQTLSDGERQKVMIAKALAQPTAFLDFPSKVEMMQLLHRLSRTTQKTIFLSTHDLELTLQIADKIWLMEKERINIGTPQTLAAEGALNRFVERDGIVFDRDQLRVIIPS